ncbi:hypothetical protein BDV29DRAFT_182834 [Aspergillus leporis]|uniref:YCII-related domain-containing protein n=1 Tax=Aspergillus leporis TaxID=41062 RepID=A0A5N5WQE7_9EURO|nr:hypothetical protein BDV29DRAFT_182834 [Aspergillus leporis]
MESTKKEFLVLLKDRPGALSKRVEVRQKHLEKIQPLIDAGTIVVGGATFDSHDATEGENPQMTGSMLIVVSESIEDVRKIVEDDVYATSGVWDLERTKILPFRTTVRLPM